MFNYIFDYIKLLFTKSKTQIVYPFLCDQIKEFGFCRGQCLERHTLCKILDKDCLNIPQKCFISIQLTKVLSAQRFYGRISKYSSMEDPVNDEHWIQFDDSFDKIKKELKIIGSTSDTKIVYQTPIIGEMVMIETEDGELFRAVVMDTFYYWFTYKIKVNLIDLGCIKEVVSNNVFVLPNHLKQYPPVTVEIIVSSMEPIGEKNWIATTTNKVRSLFEPIMLTGLECICKVELTLGKTLWIDRMLVKKCIECSHFACNLYKENPLLLPRILIEHNLASKINSKLIDKIIGLNKYVQEWKEDPLVVVQKLNTPKSLFSCEEQLVKIDKEDTVQLQWAHLSKNIIYDVSVSYSEGPTHILLRNLKFVDRLDALQKDIDEAIDNGNVRQLTDVTVGTLCLAMFIGKINKYNRSIIKQINNEIAEVLYLDYGDFNSVKIEYLLTLPVKLISKLPFQVIECKLSGFNDILEEDIFNQFNKHFIEITNTPICLKVLSSTANAKLTEGNCYEVVLFNNDININIKLAKEYNTSTDNNQIQNILSLSYEPICEDNKEDIDSQIELLNSLLKISKKKYEQNMISNSNNISEDNDKEPKKHVKIENKYCVDCNVTPMIPQCLWHQDNLCIYFKLNILLVKNYNISHTMEKLSICIENDSVSYFLTVPLYGLIKENSVACNVGFDGICIKAEKCLITKYKWPRVMKCSKKHKYMIYDTDYLVECKNMNLQKRSFNTFKMLANYKPLNITNNCISDDSDDSEQYNIYED